MENVSINWKIWGIVAFVVIGFLLLWLVGSYNAVMKLNEVNENCFRCYAGEVAYCSLEDEIPIVCPEDTMAACMYPEDFDDYYGY